MHHQDLINTCVFEKLQGLLFSDLSGPLTYFMYHETGVHVVKANVYFVDRC